METKIDNHSSNIKEKKIHKKNKTKQKHSVLENKLEEKFRSMIAYDPNTSVNIFKLLH